MAHLLDSMAYVGQLPWHGLGAELDDNQSVDQWRVAAGMDWTIKSTPVRFPTTAGLAQFPGRNVLLRSDNQAPLSVVSDKYQVVQPADVLEFFRDVTEAGNMKLETAGVLDEGRKLWALARTEFDINIGQDTLHNYCLLATACDGSMSTRAYWTSVRVVCNNTLQFSLRDRANGVSVPHSTTFKPGEVQSALGIDVVAESVQEYGDQVTALANRSMTEADTTELFEALVTKTAFNAEGREDLTSHQQKTVDELLTFSLGSPGADFDTAAGTAWGAVNAVTHHVDFHQRAADNNNRFKSAQFGDGARTKQRAMALGLELVAA